MNSDLLILFVKNLVPGRVKTRLADEIGVYQALAVYENLIDHTCFVAEKVPADRLVLYSDYLETGDIFSQDLFKRHLQHGGTLGERMSNAFKKGFGDGYKKVILIGSDCHDLHEKHLKQAFSLLDKNDVVVGPAEDGGYYLIGMNMLHDPLFENKTYSHPEVLRELALAAREQNLTLAMLDTLADIDTLADLKKSGMDLDFLT